MDFDKTYGSIHDVENSINNHGSGFMKQKRSDPDPDPHPPDDLHHYKSSRTDYFDQPNKTIFLRSDSMLSHSANDTNNMLSFSSSAKDGNQTPFFSFHQPSPVYIKNTGHGYGGLPAGMHIPASRYKGPFTPSQWMELEHQALIYKHFVANVPVPSQLLAPLRKSLNPFLFPGPSLSSTSYAPNSYGWGSFHLGYSGNTDPEPGRCRRTDGKKWRCSRDAVPDQKYCERHINRGRHRSRKPVEGHNGHAVSGPTAAKAGPAPVPTTSRTTTTAGSGAAFSRRDPAVAVPTQTPIGRPQESQVFAVMKESSDSLMYPLSYTDHGASNPNPLPHFVDQWSKHESLKGDWTQLSMSIPMAASEFSSSSNSPAQEKLTPGLTPELDLDPTHKHASNWIPISWGNSVGGPLGEVLNGKVKTPSFGLETNSLNQMTEMWDAGHYQIGSSPTGVLQKTSFVSLSNSSSGSSPKGNKKDEDGGNGSGSLCDELLLL